MTDVKDVLTEALVAIQADLPKIPKSKTAKVVTKSGETYTYKYADLSDIAAAIHPLLSEHGLAFVATPQLIDGAYLLIGTLEHVTGAKREGVFPLPQSVPPQQLGSWLTYGRRYLLGCLTGVVAEEDDDGKAASTVAPAKKQAPKKRQPLVQEPREPAPEWDNFSQQEPADDGITKAQQAKLHLLFNGNGLKDRNERLAFTSGLIKRDVTSSNELTKDEASKLIDHLEHLLKQEPS